MRSILDTPLIALTVLAVALALAGCGLGAGAAPSEVQLVVTRDFGAHTLSRANARLAVRGQETVMSLLSRNYSIDTRFGGKFVQGVDGLSGGQQAGQPVDWFYYVNGIEAPKGAADTNVHPGDHIWWDHHDWSQTDNVPAVVGTYPEPFLNGIDGKRLPVRIECTSASGSACHAVADRLRALSVPAAIAAVGSGGAPHTLRVLVGPWRRVGGDLDASAITRGPRASGVYARFSSSGDALTLLDQDGAAVQTLTSGAGLVAATSQGQDAPVWVVTGTDDGGVQRAASAFDRATLQLRFAVAIAPTGAIPLPEARP